MTSYKNSILICAFIGLLAINSCTKETTNTIEYNPEIGLYGIWKVDTSQTPGLKFINLSTDNVLISYLNLDGFKTTNPSSTFIPYEKQVIADFTSNGILTAYNYLVSGDTLTIFKGNELFVSAILTDASPIINWTISINPSTISNSKLPKNLGNGIGYNGTYLMIPFYQDGGIGLYDPDSEKFMDTIPTNTSVTGVEYDGTDYWISRNGWDVIRKINPANGSEVFTSTTMGAWIYGIASISSTQMVCYANNTRTIYMYNPTADLIAFTRDMNGLSIYLSDLTFYNGKIYAIRNGSNQIFRLNTAGFASEVTYMINGDYELQSIASIGNGDFWCKTTDGRLIKVNLP
jgi:hypothetical protein